MSRVWIPRALFVFFFSLVLAPAWAQVAGPQQAMPIIVHRATEWPPKSMKQFADVAPDITLVPRGEGARHGQLWIRTGYFMNSGLGLYIAGKVDGGQPDFPHTRDLIPSKDHIEIWLAGSRKVALPEIGWGNQFKDVTLPKGAGSCEEWAKNDQFAHGGGVEGGKRCQEWADSQVHYRQHFKRLFVRQWLLSPHDQIEAYATPAFEQIADWYSGSDDQLDEIMKPRGKLQISLYHEPSGYSFGVFIPFEAFPPLPKLNVSELYLLVDVFNPAPTGKKMGVFSTSSPVRVWGKTSTFNTLRLDPPLSFSLTSCELPLGETTNERDDHLTWFFPQLKVGGAFFVFKTLPEVSDTFVIENKSECGMWDPRGLSPWVRTIHHFWMGTGRQMDVGAGRRQAPVDQCVVTLFCRPLPVIESAFSVRFVPHGQGKAADLQNRSALHPLRLGWGMAVS